MNDLSKIRELGFSVGSESKDVLDMLWLNPFGATWENARMWSIHQELVDPAADEKFKNSHINQAMSAWAGGFVEGFKARPKK